MKIDTSKHKQYVFMMDSAKFNEWKQGNSFIRRSEEFDEYVNSLENTISKQLIIETEYGKEKIDEFNVDVIKSMFEDDYADKEIKAYYRGEYAAYLKFNDGMYVTYDEFVKMLHYYGTDAYYHFIPKSTKVLIIYMIK